MRKDTRGNKKETLIIPGVFKAWEGMNIVKISSVKEPDKLMKWLTGQTLPLVEDDPDPTGWCYAWDYLNFLKDLPVID